jgi:hypothetical protein
LAAHPLTFLFFLIFHREAQHSAQSVWPFGPAQPTTPSFLFRPESLAPAQLAYRPAQPTRLIFPARLPPLAISSRAMCRRRPPSRTRVKSYKSVRSSTSSSPSRRHRPVSTSLLTPSKPTGIKTPPPPAASLPPPRPYKTCPHPGQLHRAHPRSPIFTCSPRAPRTLSVASSPPLHPR